MTPAERVVAALDAAGCNQKGAGQHQWTARCPVQTAHSRGDRNPSLSLGESPDGKALLTCHRGCTVPEISQALALEMRDLFPEEAPRQAPTGALGTQKARYPYHDAGGELVYEIVKFVEDGGKKTFRPRRPDGKGGWIWNANGIPRVLYHLPQVLRGVEQGKTIIICEGEKDAETAQWLWPDAVATTHAFGAGKWEAAFNEDLRGAVVKIVADDDSPGHIAADIIRTHLTGIASEVTVWLPADGFKDLSEHVGAGRTEADLRPFNVTSDDLAPSWAEWEEVALPGGQALAMYGDVTTARWGDGNRILWAHGESLLIAGRTGVGKTTFALGVLAGLVGIEPLFLGLPITPAAVTLYLACDRPRQIIRAMRRRFGEDVYDVLDQRLIVRRGPLPSDLAKNPGLLHEMAVRYGAEVVVLDSLKDAAVKLTDDEVGGQINRAIQLLNAADIDGLVLHHNRKGDATQRQGDDYEPSVEDVYGSNWITSGAGSVVVLHGTPGAELVKMWHVKQPAEPIGPFMLEHDHVAGRTVIVHSFDILGWLKGRGRGGGTALEAAKAEHQKDTLKSSGKEAARAKRRLNGLVQSGLAEHIPTEGRDSAGQPKADRWRAREDYPQPVDTRDGARDGGSRNEPVTDPCRTVTELEEVQVLAVTVPVTPCDAPIPVTFAGGYIPPQHGEATKSEPLNDGSELF